MSDEIHGQAAEEFKGNHRTVPVRVVQSASGVNPDVNVEVTLSAVQAPPSEDEIRSWIGLLDRCRAGIQIGIERTAAEMKARSSFTEHLKIRSRRMLELIDTQEAITRARQQMVRCLEGWGI